MQFDSRRLFRWTCSSLFAFMLAGCGGGGGGTTSGDAPVASNESTPRLSFTPTNMGLASSGVVGYGEVTLEFGQVAVDITRRYRDAGAQLSSTETCRNGGVANISLLDADGNGKASGGDTVTVTWRDCLVAMFAEVFSGTITIDITEATYSSLKANLKFNQGLSLASSIPDITAMFLGSLATDWTTDDFRTTLNVKSTQTDDFRFFAKGPARSATEAFKSISLTKELRFDEVRSAITMAMRYESDILGGVIAVSTPQPLLAYINKYPDAGHVELRAAGAGFITVRANLGTESKTYSIELDNNGDGKIETKIADTWDASSVGFLWSDGNLTGSEPKQPYKIEVTKPSDFAYSVDYINNPGPNDTLRIQFSRPLSNGTSLKFRLRGSDFVSSFVGTVSKYIDTTSEGRGARYLVRWQAPLQHNRGYVVEFSYDGLEWTAVPPVNDTLGNALPVNANTAIITTPNSMRAVITSTSSQLGPAIDFSQLDATASTSDRPIASYSWKQISGPAILFDSTDSPKTIVKIENPVRFDFIEEIVIELTITDIDGDAETARVSLFV